MPNHTSTIFKVTGTPKDIEEFKKKAARTYPGGETGIFSFGSFDPCPEELHNVTSPVSICSEEEYKEQEEKKAAIITECRAKGEDPHYQLFGMGKITEAMRQDLINRFSADNWYDWQSQHWGTKWDCYEVSNEWMETVDPNDEYSVTIQCFYLTAWSPGTPAIQTMSEQFPSLRFEHRFADEGGGFLGYEVIQDGETLEDVSLDWNSEEGIELRKELGRWHDEDEEEEEEVEVK